MIKNNLIKIFLLVSLLITVEIVVAQNPINWTATELMEPAELAGLIKDKKALPHIISVGPGAPIPHSIDIGSVKDADSFQKFKQHINSLDKDASIVVYCGCCPFEHCPNVRPAIATLKEMKFSNYKLLNIPKNLKVDWLDKGYPTKD